MKTKYIVTDNHIIIRFYGIVGRNAWALSELIRAGDKGCTSITHPGPRWSAYVHRLRHYYGLRIETIRETHSGPFPGSYARYVLLSKVYIVASDNEAA